MPDPIVTEKPITLQSFKDWGAKGGASVTGKKKKRSRAHYKRISALGVAARKARLVASVA